MPREARASAAPYTLQVRDTIGRSWEHEPINWELTPKPGEFAGGPVLVQRDGRAIPAQADVLEKHPDGSARKVVVRLVIDRLDRDASAQLTAELGKEGPSQSALRILQGKGALVLDNGLAAARLLNRNVSQAASGEFSPLLAIRLPSGRWTGSGQYATRTKPIGTRTELLEPGPVRLAVRLTTTSKNDGALKWPDPGGPRSDQASDERFDR